MSQTTDATPLSRRQVLALAGALALAGLGARGARADAAAVQASIAKITGGAAMQEGAISLELPEIAENGNTVPVKFEVESPMTAENHVRSVHLFAEGNPLPDVASFHFTPASGKAAAATRMRLAQTQTVTAVAQMSDGTLYTASREVKVTIGGCGG